MTDDGMPPLDDIERELDDLGPLMAQQEMALASEPDPEFVRSLRNRLTGEAEPARARRGSLRERLSGWARRYWLPAGGLAAAAVVALFVVLGGNRGPGPGPTSTQSAFAVPTPGRADLTRSYPPPLGLGAGPPQVWYSPLQPPPGTVYAGQLTLQGHPRPVVSARAPAYRLQGARFDLPRLQALAQVLHIGGPVQHITVRRDRWAYVAQGSGPAVHSIAINVRTGELVYHDYSHVHGASHLPPRVTSRQVAAARSWLAKLGWPARAMPLRRPTSGQEKVFPWVVAFNWPRGFADVPAASVTLDTTGTVTDALLEPPIAAERAVALVTPRDAWDVIKRRGGPIGVEAMVGPSSPPGRAVLTQTRLIDVLTHAADGRSYLVPSYRFEGVATIRSVRPVKRWVAIVAAVR